MSVKGQIWNAPQRPRITLDRIRHTITTHHRLKRKTLRKVCRKRPQQQRKERHVRWYPDTMYRMIRPGTPLETTPETPYQAGALREHHLYHFKHISPEALRNMKRPKYVGVFRLTCFETPVGANGAGASVEPYYVKPQDKYLKQLYGFDKHHPLPKHDPGARNNRKLAWTMVDDARATCPIPYHIDIFAIRGKKSQQNSQNRRTKNQNAEETQIAVDPIP